MRFSKINASIAILGLLSLHASFADETQVSPDHNKRAVIKYQDGADSNPYTIYIQGKPFQPSSPKLPVPVEGLENGFGFPEIQTGWSPNSRFFMIEAQYKRGGSLFVIDTNEKKLSLQPINPNLDAWKTPPQIAALRPPDYIGYQFLKNGTLRVAYYTTITGFEGTYECDIINLGSHKGPLKYRLATKEERRDP